MVTFERIGSFVSYAITNAYRFGYEENIYTIQSSVKSLMTKNDIDQLKLSILFGINTYSNLHLLESFEFDSVEELNMKYCYKNSSTEPNFLKEFLKESKKNSENVFSDPLPCSKFSNFPKCKLYCEWHQKGVRNSLMDIGNLLRY